MKEFATQHDAIIFVSGKKSSNGKSLFHICQSVNPNSFFISSKEELRITSYNVCYTKLLRKQPGVSQITTGAGISKPVIRGLGYNRVVVVNDGIRQEGQQWGDEHGIEIDEYGVNHVEILKGPASLAFGSDAMAGVINMISAPTLPDGSLQGNVITNYQSNNGLCGYSANLSGNNKGFIWDARISGKRAHDYRITSYNVCYTKLLRLP